MILSDIDEKAALGDLDSKNRSNPGRENPGAQKSIIDDGDINQEMDIPHLDHGYSCTDWTFHADILRKFLKSDMITVHELLQRLSVSRIYSN